MGVFNPDLKTEHVKDTFPYSGQDFETTKTVVINKKSDVWERMAAWNMPDERKYTAAINRLASPKTLFDLESVSIIKQFIYCKDMSTPAFSGPYTEQPAWWLDACDIIQNNISLAEEHKSKLEKLSNE